MSAYVNDSFEDSSSSSDSSTLSIESVRVVVRREDPMARLEKNEKEVDQVTEEALKAPELFKKAEPRRIKTPEPIEEPKEKPKESEAWVVEFGSPNRSHDRKMTRKERNAMLGKHLKGIGSLGADSEGNEVGRIGGGGLQVMKLDGLANLSAVIPDYPMTTRAHLMERVVFRIPRLLCIQKQYPRSCGMSSFVSIYNYLYSWLGESELGADRAPLTQERIMDILGFPPPFGEISWGSFTGNATLLRWFHALNHHFNLPGRAYILYKVHGAGNTQRKYELSDPHASHEDAALKAMKKALRDPHCALIYHCYNHYMVPVGFQEIPHHQVDNLKPVVPPEETDCSIFIGEVSRGKHDALYARKWKDIVKDLSTHGSTFFNIRHPELGLQQRGKKAAAQPTPTPPSASVVPPFSPELMTMMNHEVNHAGLSTPRPAAERFTPRFVDPQATPRSNRSSRPPSTGHTNPGSPYDLSRGPLHLPEMYSPKPKSIVPSLNRSLVKLESSGSYHNGENLSSRGSVLPSSAAPAFPSLPKDAGSTSSRSPRSFSVTALSSEALSQWDQSGTSNPALSGVMPLQATTLIPSQPALSTGSASVSMAIPEECPRSCRKRSGVPSARGKESECISPPASRRKQKIAGESPTAKRTNPSCVSPNTRAKPKNNLHCIICFRNDEIEPDINHFLSRPTSASSKKVSSRLSKKKVEVDESSSEDDNTSDDDAEFFSKFSESMEVRAL